MLTTYPYMHSAYNNLTYTNLIFVSILSFRKVYAVVNILPVTIEHSSSTNNTFISLPLIDFLKDF